MTFRLPLLAAALLLGALLPSPADGQTHRRSESFFGLHFDHHSELSDEHAGRTLTAGMIDSLLAAAQPDYIQVDTKGHPGIASYPSRYGTPVRSFVRDPLALFREATKRRGVGLYSHYSGVIDSRAIALHPEWAVVNLDGTRHAEATSFYSPYVDSILIPQLKELSDRGIDGVWLDGDSWGAKPDFRPEAKAAFTQRTGLAAPTSENDPNFMPYLDFTRDLFKEYVARYIAAMRAYNPRFQICSNWAYSSFMPEPVTLDVDFLSGDVASGNTVYSAAFEARCLAPQGQMFGKPWDLMAWSFAYNWNETPKKQSPKSTVHLLQEAAETIAMGGGFQVYYTQNEDLSLQMWMLPQVTEIGAFMRARQAFTQGATPEPQTALLYAGDALRRTSKLVYDLPRAAADPLRGYSALLLDGRQPYEILMEHHLRGRMRPYGLIIVPEWGYLDPALKTELTAYVQEGGALLVAGVDAVKLFEEELGVRLVGEPERRNQFLHFGGRLANIDARCQRVEAGPGAEVIGRLHPGKDVRGPGEIAATVRTLGKGRIGGIYTDLGAYYLVGKSPVHRDFVAAAARRLFPEPALGVEGPGPVHAALSRKDGRLLVHLINAGGDASNPNVAAYDAVAPLTGLTVTLRTPTRPKAVTAQPGGQAVPFTWADGVLRAAAPPVEVHTILVVE